MQDTNEDADPDLKHQDDEGQDTLALYHFFDQVAEAEKRNRPTQTGRARER